MSVVKFVKNLLLTGAMFFSTYESYALSALDINYPSVAQLKQLQLNSTPVNNVEQKSRLLAQSNKQQKVSGKASYEAY